MKLRNIPIGPEKKKMKKSKKTNPNCSNKACVSIFMGKIEKSNFEPSSGGIGIRLKKANRTFQKTTITHNSNIIDPNEPATTEETLDQSLKFKMISALAAEGMAIKRAATVNSKAAAIFDIGPARATSAGPHF